MYNYSLWKIQTLKDEDILILVAEQPRWAEMLQVCKEIPKWAIEQGDTQCQLVSALRPTVIGPNCN